MDDNIKKLHQALIDDGYDDVGTEQEFRDYVSDSKNVATLYNALSEAGYDNFKDQKSLETYLSAKAPVAQKPSTPQSSGQSVYSKEKKQTQYPQEVLDAYNSPDNKPGNFKDLAQLNDEYQRGVLKKPGIISQALGMMPKVDAGNIGREQKMGGMITNMLLGDNMQQPQQTQQLQDNNQQVQQPAQQEASPESKEENPVTAPTSVVNNEGLMDAKLANYLENWKQRPDKQSTYFENLVADLLADGTANSNEEAVNMVMPALHRYANRSAMDVTNQVVSALPDDTVQDAEKSIEAQWYSHGVQDKLKQEADNMGISYDDYVGLFLKPAMVQSLVNKYGPNYRNIAEGIATRLYSHDENVQDRLMNQDINDALSSVINKYVNPSVVDEYNKAQEAGSKAFTEGMEGSQFIPANLRLGTALGAQYEANEAKDPAKVLSSLQKKFGRLYRNPEFLNDMSNAAFKVMQRYGLNGTQSSDPKQFKPMINSVLKNELDQLEIKGMMPKGSAEYIMKTGLGNTIVGKITRKAVQTDYQNWLEDIANQQYHPGFWENVASGALTFAGDAWSYWLPGAAGGKLTKSMVAKAEGKLAGDLMAKGMERKMAERAAKVLIGKSKAAALKSGAAHGAVTFGGQSAISKPIDEIYRTGQFDENGKIYNPSVGKVIANTLGEVAQQSAVGAIMQGGTIANMVGKGRGLATNILADIGGKVVDSGIMTGHQILERMAHDPNFKPTGKDAAESFLESMANLTAIGLPGMVGKYARFKDAREFNKKFDFTDQDIAELKRFGYDGLRDAFEKMGIGEYAVVGENAQRLDGQLTQKYMDLINDKSVPEVLKAKMMAVVEGKRPSSFSPVIDSEVYRGDDGKYYLETYNKDGGVIDRKEYSSHDAARNDEKKLEYEKTLGLASVLEGEFHNEFTQEHIEGLYNKAAQKYNMGEKLTDEDKAAVYLYQNASAIKEIMDKQQKGIILTDEEQKQVNAYRHYYDSALENSSVMREFVNTFEDSHDVAHGTLRKALESKDKKYAPLVESYLKELYNSIELKREMKQTMDDLYNTSHGNEQKRIEGESPVSPIEGSSESSAGGQEPPVSEGPAPYQDRTKTVPTPSDAEFAANPANLANENQSESKASDAFVMGQNAYKNGDKEGLKSIKYNAETAELRLKRAFANDTDRIQGVYNAVNKGTDIETYIEQRTNYLTPFQQEAIRKYAEAMDANKGAMDALEHADDGYADKLKQQLSQYTMENGNISSLTLTDGQRGYWKSKNEYGAGFGVFPDANGQPVVKQVSSSQVKENGKEIPLQEYVNQLATQKHEATKKNFNAIFDATSLKPNDTVSLSINDKDQPTEAKIVSVNPDGTISFNIAGSKNVTTVPVDTFTKFQKYALRNSINAELDAEDAERAEKEAIKVEAEKKQRFADGIVGLSEQKPDYSSKETDPKVAAEYLQEQYADNHDQLIKLVNGSRSDIKEQIDNIRKRIVEAEDWLDTNADLEPEQAQSREDKLKLAKEQLEDLTTRYDNWNKIRSLIMTEEEKRELKDERTANIKKVGIDKEALTVTDEREVPVVTDEELKKQYPTMDEASDYITSQRKDIYHTQEDVERKINGVNDMLDLYINGETELDPTQLMELNTSKAQLEALQTNLSVAAKGLKAQANKLSKLYKTEVSQKEMEELGMTPSEQRKALVTDALKKNDMKAIHEIYKDASVDVMDLTPQTLEEAVSESLLPHSLNPESLQYELGKSNFKFGIGKGYDSNKFNYLIAKKGTGMSVNEFAVRVYNDLPVNLLDMGYTDQDVRNALLDMFKSYDSVKEMRNVALMNRIAAAEDELSSEEEYYEAQKEREIIERQAEIEKYNSFIHEKELSLPSESELDHIYGLEYDRMMEIEDREREYKQYVKSILPELADYDDRSNDKGYGGGSSLGSDSSRRGVDEGNSQGEEVGNGEASSESEIGEGSDSGRKGRQETGSLERGEGSAVRGSHLPQETSFGERLKSAIAETETEPTEAQKKAGNYKKGHLSFGGYDYTVETPKGVTRSGKDEQGKPWSVIMHDTYGYILGKIGVDGDHIDMFINDAADLDTFDGNVYVVDQVNPETGEFDEHKVMYGYPSEEAATEAYLANYSKGWKGLGKVTSVPKATFDKWLESSDRKTKPFAEYAMVQKEQRAAYEEEMMQDGAHSEAFDKIVDLAKEQKEYWDLMEQGEVDPNDVPEVDVAHEMDELLKTLSDEEFKEVSDVLQNIDEEFEYFTADEYERREDLAERKNAAAYSEFLKQETKSIAPFADALRNAVNSGDKKAIAKAQKELTDALLASNLGHGYLSGQLEYAKSAKKKDESYSERRAFIKPLTDAINAIESELDSALADVGLEGVHVDFKEYGYGWIYADKGSDWRDRLEPLDNDYRNVSQYSDVNPISVLPQITMNNVKKVAGIIKSRIEEGERYNSDENQDENIEEVQKEQAKFDRDVKEVKPENLTEAQKVAYDAVSTMLKKAGIPVKVVSNEDMEKVAEVQDNLAVEMLLNDPRLRFYIKTPEQKEAAKAAYDWAAKNRPDKFKQYAIVNMDNPNQPPQYFEKKDLAEKWRKYYTNAWKIGNYKAFNLNKPFEEQIKDVKGDVPSEFDPYKAESLLNKRIELEKQIKETEDSYNAKKKERAEYQNQLMQDYMDQHGLSSENDIPDDVWTDYRDKSFEKYQDTLDDLFHKYVELDNQLKAVAEPGVRFLRTYHGSGASFDKFDLSHALEGEGSETFGHGVYVTSSREIGREYAQRAKQKKMTNLYKTIRYPDGVKGDTLKRRLFGEMVNDVATGGDVKSAKEFAKKRVGADANDVQRTLEHLKDREKGTEYEQNLKDGLAKYKDALKWIDSLDDDYLTQGNATRYEVEIPEDNGSNYLEWEGKVPDSLDKQKVVENAYKVVSDDQGFKDYKATPLNDFIAHTLKTYVDTTDVAASVEKLKSDIKDVIEDDLADDDVLALNEYLKDATPYDVLATIWYNDLVRDINNAGTGEELYRKLSTYVGDNAASQILSDNGLVGIKYPAGMIHGGAKEGDYNYVVFDENNANIVGNTKFAQGKGVVYGYTDGKQIVLNQEHLNPNTPIHEYQHLWRTAAKEMNPELIEHGDKLIMQTQLFADLKQDPNYNYLTDEQICDEAFARLTGEDGAAILEQMAKDAIKENPLDTAKELSVINKLKEWLKKFWYWTLDTFTKWKPEDIKRMTLEDIRNLVLRDLANGVDPRTKFHEAENADDIKFMGSTTKKRMKDISTQLEGRELDEAQQAVADVYSGKKDNVSLTVEREDGSNKIIMRQGNDNHAGTKHSVFRHYGVKANSLNVDDLLLIPTVLKEGERKVSDNGRVAYVYVDPTSQVKYTVVTEPKNNKEYFNDFYSNKKANPSETSRVVENSTNTPEGAHNNDGNAFMRAKVDNNSETAKENGGNLSVEDKIKAVSQQFGVDEADVAMYANSVKKGSTAEAARARANIKRHLLQANEDKISSFKELLKYTVPVNNALKENFGDLDAMIEERVKQVEAQRNAMEAARKRAEEEEAKRQKHLEELSLIPDDQLDKQYMDALAKGDDATAREMLDEAARRKGYDDTESSYQGVGAWAAPGNPGYESDKARRDDWESSGSDVNLEDIALGYTPQPDDYFSHPERYSQNTPHGLESVKAINTAIDAIKNGEKDVKVKVYRAVPTSVKEGKLRNGDWVTPSKKYAEMHGTNRLEGKYRIIEDEVPANQLWWDGNDANEFGFDDGKEYKYKNAKNNRKLNDLVTYDDKGDVIPPSKRFNSRKSDVRFHRSDGANLPSEEDNKPKKKTERGRIDEATGAFKLAPNGEQSNLSKKQYIEARTKNFKDWFGGDWEKKPKDFKNKLDANGEPLEKYVEGYLNRPKKPTMPKKRKGEDEATFFGRKMLYSQALEDWPKTEADWKKRIDEFDENTLATLTPPDEEAIREKYQKQYENDMASWRKDHPYIKEGEERPLEIPDMRDYQSIQDYGEALRKYEIWKTAPHKDEYDRMAEDEIISKVALMDAVQHPFSEYARLKAMKAEFQHMRHVMQNQKVYDQNTTDAVVQFAKRFMSLGYGDDLGRGSINTLLTIVKNSTGKKSYEISQQLYQVMDVLMNNQLRNFDRAVMKTMSIKELKENAKGIQVQGKLELRGQTTIKAFRDAVSSRISSDKLDEKISNLIDKMAADKKNASSYQDELLGLNLAKQYVDYIDSSRNDAIEIEDLKKLEIENYKDRKGIYKGERTKALLQEHVERLNQYDEALFNNKVERMDRYLQLLANLGGMIDESVKGAREFQERDARRAIKVKMMASADLGDKSMNQHHKENWKTRLSNSDVARLFCSPLGSFDALMREFGSKQINGEGQLWNHFVRGAMKASNDAFKSVREANNEIDLKVSELFGKVTEDKNGNKKGNMTLNDLYALERSNKVKSLDVTIRDIEGEQTYKLQQGNLMYIYMVNKMPDGAMKLREMRILDADVERIKENIDPRFLKLADWIQGEFLPKMRTKYNKRHEELFGAPMPMVENYFPLRVLKNARYMEEDVNNTSDGSNALPSTATGAIIKRKTNKLPLDILNADALSVTIDNIKEMENWYNYAPIRKDANTLLSDTTFRNRVQNMTTIYGSGERLWNNVKDATAVAMGTYRPKGGTDLAVSIKNIGKGITGAKISGRLYTAFKQILSFPLFLADADLGRFAWYSVNPYGSFKWAIENMPNFDKRWSGRKLGDTVLMDDPTDWKLWHTNLMEKAAYYGMTPNALVDAVTCAVGARAVYDTKYKQYIKAGLTEEKAKEKALSDAEINFNTSQQSSEGAFVSPMQLDRTLESAIFTPFRNSSMLYERKGINALRNLKHRFEKGHKEASIKYMAAQLMEEGVGYEQATKAAEKMYKKGLMHNIADAIVALWLGPIIWNLGGSLGYLIPYLGDDENKKKKMVIDAVILGLLEGPVDGLAGGQFINTAIANTITSDGISLKGLKNVDFSGMPMLSDFNSMIEKFGYDKVAGAQDLMFMVMQSGTGFNPKTLTDAINACIDYGNGDMTNAKEIALFVFRLMNGPAATVDNLYIDELGMKGKDAKKLSYEELAKRYAEYKFGKNTFGLGKLYSDEEKQKKLKAIEKSFDKKVSERLAGMDREDLKNEFSESRSQKEKKLIGKIIADELETKDSEAVKKAKADASYLRQRNFSDLMDDLYLQKEWEATNEANAGLEELKGNGASEKEIEAYKTKHKADLDKRKAIQKARKKMQKKKADISSDNDEATMAAIRKLRDSILKTVRQTKK